MSEQDREWVDEFASAFASSFLAVTIDHDAQASPLPINPLRTVQRLDQNELLDILNLEDESTPPATGTLGHIDRMNSASIKVSEFLRRWIDEWLDSGRTAGGVECPTSRNYVDAKLVSTAVYKYSTRGKMHLLGTRNGLELWFDLQDGKIPKDGRGWPRSLFIDTVASEKLVLFLLSDLSYKLAKCRDPECGRYFVLKHWNRTYKTGTHCEECSRIRSLKSAAAATVDEREAAQRKLHDCAANRFRGQIAENHNWHKDTKLKERIARYLKGKIESSADLTRAYPAGVTGKWVARKTNWEAIEAAAKKERVADVSVSL
jgi:hypothetical protein